MTMHDYYYEISNWICIDKYDIFFELNGPDFVLITNLYFGMTYIKLLDHALRHSKKNILKSCEKNSKDLFEAATYPNGDALGFYNTCPFDLGDIAKIVSNSEASERLLTYIDCFSDNVKDVFREIDFKEALDFLVEYELLTTFIGMVCKKEFDDDKFSDYDSFIGFFEEFIYYMAHDEYYNMGLEEISNYDPKNSYLYIRESIDEYGEFLNRLLLVDIKLKNNETYNIYDPNSNGAYLLHKTKRDIMKINPNAEVNLYGKSIMNENRALYLAKKSVSKIDPYLISDAIVINPEESLFERTSLEKYDDLDFMVTNSIGSELTEYKEILHAYSNNQIESAKSVLAFKGIDDILETIRKIVNNDCLEAFICFSTHHIMILNPKKSEKKKGKFLFVDRSDVQEEERILGRSYQSDLYSNYQFYLFNTGSAMELSEFDKNQMKTIVELYEKFEDSDFSIIIENEDFNQDTLELLLI